VTGPNNPETWKSARDMETEILVFLPAQLPGLNWKSNSLVFFLKKKSGRTVKVSIHEYVFVIKN
jgi:hypothetical protein